MEACSCGLRRFFTNLYSLPSFLFLLAAASLLPSLAHTQTEKSQGYSLAYRFYLDHSDNELSIFIMDVNF